MKPHGLIALAALFLLGSCDRARELVGGGDGKWCRIDDPGFVEQRRRQLKLPRDKADTIDCSERAPVASLPDELVLPMPCGRKMVFRAVRVAVGDALDSETAHFGDPDAEDAFRKAISGPWWGEVAGGFTARPDGSGSSTLYIGKYEVTRPQFAAMADGGKSCTQADEAVAAVDGTDVLPQTGVSWHDAVAFADSYTRWLLGQDGGAALPANQARPGFLRLPTEAEWEFAARGGRETGGPTRVYEPAPGYGPPGSARLADVAWYREVGVTPPEGEAVFPIGRKAPNRLMIFDMLGNAEELTADLFQPVRPDGIKAGRRGGMVVRGGSSMDEAAQIGVGSRREMELYLPDGPARGPSVGFRLVIAAPYFVNMRDSNGKELQGNPAFSTAVTQAWNRLVRAEGTAGSGQRSAAQSQLVALSAQLGGNSATAGMVAAIRSQLDEASAQVAIREQRSTEEQLLAALLAAGYARERAGKLKTMRDTVAAAEAGELTEANREMIRNMAALVPANLREMQSSYDYYVATIEGLGKRPASEFEQSVAVVADRLRRAGLERLLVLLPVARQHVLSARSAAPGSDARARWIREIGAVRV
ncbi:hypothetical protein CAP39_04980 [Sphingomonas sp. IBVSS1]|nr:hypothetical protein CAP39_04980 [Sphingomonas sp. IBVSS1]